MSAELLPCPFCGSKPKLVKQNVGSLSTGNQWLQKYVCSKFECAVQLGFGEWSTEEARNKWNKRTPPPVSGKIKKEGEGSK